VDELANLSPDKIEAMLDRLEAEKIRRLSELKGDAYAAAVKKLEWMSWLGMPGINVVPTASPPAKPDCAVASNAGRTDRGPSPPPSAKVVSLSEARARRANTDLGEAYR
jgi:hypothetical protein